MRALRVLLVRHGGEVASPSRLCRQPPGSQPRWTRRVCGCQHTMRGLLVVSAAVAIPRRHVVVPRGKPPSSWSRVGKPCRGSNCTLAVLPHGGGASVFFIGSLLTHSAGGLCATGCARDAAHRRAPGDLMTRVAWPRVRLPWAAWGHNIVPTPSALCSSWCRSVVACCPMCVYVCVLSPSSAARGLGILGTPC